MRSYSEYLQSRVDQLQKVTLIQKAVICVLSIAIACCAFFV
jgi:hypothetical protein